MADNSAKQPPNFSRDLLGPVIAPILVFGGAWLAVTLLFKWLPPSPEWADAKLWACVCTMGYLLQQVSRRGGDEIDRKFPAKAPATKQVALMKSRIIAAYSVPVGVLFWFFAPSEGSSLWASPWVTVTVSILFVVTLLIQCRRYYQAFEEKPTE